MVIRPFNKCTFGQHFACPKIQRFPSFYLFIIIIEKRSITWVLSVSGSRALCMGPTTSLTAKFTLKLHCLVGSVHCLWDPQTFFSTKTFIKSRSHDTIHTFKNYFLQCFQFLVFSKISDIQNKLIIQSTHVLSLNLGIQIYNPISQQRIKDKGRKKYKLLLPTQATFFLQQTICILKY